jgi:hypothetical protein
LGQALVKSGLRPAFYIKSKVAFPKTEVLGKPPYPNIKNFLKPEKFPVF